MKKYFFFISLLLLINGCAEKITSLEKESVSATKESIINRVDESPILQAEIDATDSVLELENRNYYLASPVRLKSNLHIKGNGATFVISEDNKFVAMMLQGLTNVVLEDFKIIGQHKIKGNPPNNSRNSFLIQARNSKDIHLNKITIRDHAFTAVYFADVSDLTVKNCLIENIGYKSPDNSKPQPHYDYDGIFLGGYTFSKNVEISNCRFINMGPGDGDGIHTQTTEPNSLQNVVIKECYFEKCDARCIKMQSGSDFKITNNIFRDSYVGIGISMANDVSNVDISQNNFDNVRMVWGTNGIWNVTATNINFSNNQIRNAGQVYRTSGKSKLTNFKISNNVADSIDYYFIDGLMFNGEISNNTITNFGLRKNKSLYMGLLIAGTSEDIVIKNNRISTDVKTHCAIYIQMLTKNIQVFGNDISMPETGLKDGYIIHYSGTAPSKKADNKKALKDNKITIRD